jgi:hypothetical protein
MSKHYIYKMEIVDSDLYYGVYIGQHKIGKKDPSCDGYNGSGSKWKKYILSNHVPVKKTILRLCEDIEETNYWEQYYIEEAIQSGVFLWNVVKGGGGHESDRIYTTVEIKAHDKARFQKWYEENKEHLKEYRKQYWEKNKEWMAPKKKQYSESHKELNSVYIRQYYKDNKEAITENHKQYYERNKAKLAEQRKEYGKQYRITHVEQEAKRHKKYVEEHKEEREKYYTQQCCYNGKVMTFRALTLRFRREGFSNPTELAKQYLIKEENTNDLCDY